MTPPSIVHHAQPNHDPPRTTATDGVRAASRRSDRRRWPPVRVGIRGTLKADDEEKGLFVGLGETDVLGREEPSGPAASIEAGETRPRPPHKACATGAGAARKPS